MKNNNTVYSIPKISSFVEFANAIYKGKEDAHTGCIYLIKYKDNKNKYLPKNIYEFYTNIIDNYQDGDIAYFSNKLSKKKICLIFYGKKRYTKLTEEFGSIINSKIINGTWKIINQIDSKLLQNFYFGWGINQYKFNNFSRTKAIIVNSIMMRNNLIKLMSAISYGRELINVPSNDMGPEALEKSFIDFSNYHKAKINIIKGADIRNSFPLIYAVGKGSIEGPRLLELNIGKKNDPLVILVGKGVCFDTGGLDLKPSQYMRNMKKDMGGAASVLSLAHDIITSKLSINLKVLIPAVYNDIGPSSMRPGDVYNSRLGLTVEIGNTDAEGRLILADSLTYAGSFKPKLLINFATLTGSARVALGPDLPAYFTHDDKLAAYIDMISKDGQDPLWRLPLYAGYTDWLHSDVADTNNISVGGHAGAITAALFLNKFVRPKEKWIHIDTYAWNDKNRCGYTKGGSILAVRTIYKLIKNFINNL